MNAPTSEAPPARTPARRQPPDAAREPVPAPATAEIEGDEPRAKWTGILFVHGMGSQRRYGDVSALVEALDTHARGGKDGHFFGIDVKLEPVTRPDVSPVAYLEAKWEHAVVAERTYPRYRFYEAYWAPVTAAGVPKRQVITWLFAQVAKPLGGFVTSWRGKARLRRAILQGMPGVDIDDVRKLFEAYDDYEGNEARRDHGKPHFSDFEEFLRNGGADARIPQPEREGLIAIARRWHRACVRAEFSNLFVLLTLAAVVLGVVGLVVMTAVAVRLGDVPDGWTLRDLARYIRDEKATFAMLASTAFMIPGLASSLEEYLGDVVFWTTYEETQTRYEKRRQILAEVRSYLAHLQRHPGCERIVVVAHSLGTAIAVDAILAEARDARALQGKERTEQLLNQRKITHVVTYGSPIDKIHYFFERDPEQHRYHRVVEDLRGDIGTEPFGNNNGRAWVHWVNFWDRADFVSGVLESPADRRHPQLRVDNVEVSSGPLINPMRAHTGYLSRPPVLDALLDIIINKSTGHRGPGGIAYRGPGRVGKRAKVQIAAAIVVVWILVAALAYSIVRVDVGLAASIAVGLAVVIVLTTVAGAGRKFLTNLGIAFESLRALVGL